MHDPTDPLSTTARRLLRLEPDAYAALVHRGPGSAAARDLLETVKPGQLLGSGVVRRPEDGDAVLAALWLWHDWLDESHAIAQGIETSNGSFWHAIMHRREGDFSNAKYWYACCAEHPILPSLGAQASAIVNPLPADKQILRLVASGWNPAAFVDFIAQLHDQPLDPRYRLAVALQRLEWRVLFDHCTRRAAGG